MKSIFVKTSVFFLLCIISFEKCAGKRKAFSGNPVYQFASNLLNQVALENGGSGGQKNILISPFSIRTALSVIYLGARGQTAQELQNVLQLPVDQTEVVENLARQISTTATSETSTFKIGNGLFLDKSFTANDTLVKTMKSQLGSNVQNVDFKGNPASASATINKWISSITQGHIQNLVTPTASSTPSLSFLLANALFYQGQWAKPFTVLPKKESFKLDTGSQVKVTTMGLESTFGYSFIPELKAVGISLPFKDDRFNFIILKPDEGLTVENVRPLLANYPIEKLAQKLDDNLRTVTLTLPKFQLKANYDTVNVIRKMGISSLFDPTKADLSGLARSSSSTQPPVVSRMVHQTLLDINELGATGAAGTALSSYPISVASALDIDKPFLFLLNDRLTGPVLIGQLMNPLE